MVEESEAEDVNLALDLILKTEEEEISRSQALVYLARFYLGHSKLTTGGSRAGKLEH